MNLAEKLQGGILYVILLTDEKYYIHFGHTLYYQFFARPQKNVWGKQFQLYDVHTGADFQQK